MSSLLSGLRPPAGPIAGRWGFGLGDVAVSLTRAPEPVDKLVRLLNHFGGLAISDRTVEFDGDAVDWSDVKDVETHSLVGYLLSGALDKQVAKLPVPRFPGRGLVLDLASDTVLTALIAAAGPALNGVLAVRIPAEVNYRGRLRTRTLTPGVLGTLLLADPAVRTALIDTAEAHGVAVRHADDDAVDEASRRAERLKCLVAKGYRLVRRTVGS